MVTSSICDDKKFALTSLFIANVHQPWTNYVNNGNEYLIIGAVVRSEYSNIFIYI